MSDIVDTLRALIRHELRARRPLELGEVTAVQPMDGADGNHQVHVLLHGGEVAGPELQHVPVLAARAGLSALPRVGDLVAVAFAGDDINRPVVLGMLYSDAVRPPQAAAEEFVYQPPDAEDAALRRLHLELPSGLTLTLTDDGVSLAAGATTLRIDRDGDVVVEAQGAVQVQAAADVAVTAQGALALEAAAELSLKGASVSIEGDAAATLKAPTLTLAGNTSLQPS
ncbi:MAG: phage baseplate assembly protein V [Acidobacteriota bacterium]